MARPVVRNGVRGCSTGGRKGGRRNGKGKITLDVVKYKTNDASRGKQKV